MLRRVATIALIVGAIVACSIGGPLPTQDGTPQPALIAYGYLPSGLAIGAKSQSVFGCDASRASADGQWNIQLPLALYGGFGVERFNFQLTARISTSTTVITYYALFTGSGAFIVGTVDATDPAVPVQIDTPMWFRIELTPVNL